MPWQLTTPIVAGDLDSGGPYNQVLIADENHDSKRKMIHLILEYGNTVVDEWVEGVAPRDMDTTHTILDQKYDDLVSTHLTDDGELTFDAAKRGLYEHLNSEGVIPPGSVV